MRNDNRHYGRVRTTLGWMMVGVLALAGMWNELRAQENATTQSGETQITETQRADIATTQAAGGVADGKTAEGAEAEVGGQDFVVKPLVDVSGRKGARVVLRGTIDNYTTGSARRDILSAVKNHGAGVIYLEIETYGGAVSAALDFSRFIKQRDDLHVVAVVNDKAISAGALIAMACDEIWMMKGSVIGDCAPIAMVPGQGLQPLPEAERAKIESPIVADFRDSARRNGQDEMMAVSMVQVGKVVYLVEKDGKRRFVDEAGYEALKKQGWANVEGVPVPLDAKDSLLTIYDDIAEKIGLSRGTVTDTAEVASKRGAAVVANYVPGFGDVVIGLLASDLVRGLLISVVLVSLYMALSQPGSGPPEVVCVIALGLLLGVPAMTGYAQWYEIAAVLIGIVLLAVEVFVLPGFGVAGLTGLCLIAVGLLMTFVPMEPPALPGGAPGGGGGGGGGGWSPVLAQTWDALKTGATMMTGGLVLAVIGAVLVTRYLGVLPWGSRLILKTTVGDAVRADGKTGGSKVGAWPPVGMVLETTTDLRPGGMAEVVDAVSKAVKSLHVVSDSGFVAKGSKVRVIEVTGNRVVVRMEG